ncbi:hypothetical protein [Luteibacter sp. 22Crub2.1]|uniref:hypothetical protein n=1 Tax=Luteibacter sp. 22Crub2.1 TaxID=1283288 RepID=UPI0009A650AD|nr:hypothetical protein [Luteibacter sp. 22Crub2.1]SKB73673.1 AT hook motif-containing protein [Luteibacter sp. 22Crub2.1]
MKDNRDPGTLDLLGPAKRGRGRPRKADALSNAERQRLHRARVKAKEQIAAVSADPGLQLLAATFRDLIEAEARAKAGCTSDELTALLTRAVNRFS